MNWTKTPNGILDAISDMSEAELKLTLVIVRHTIGYHRESVRMTYDDMETLTKLSRPAVGRAINQIEKRGFFTRGRKSMWVVNSNNLLLNEGENSNNSLLSEEENSNKLLPYYSNNLLPPSIKDKEKKEEKKKGEDKPPPTHAPSPAALRAEMIIKLCGLDSDVPTHKRKAGWAAGQVAKFSPEYLQARYEYTDTPNGSWYWYRDDWRGVAGQTPTPENIVETITKDRKLTKGGKGQTGKTTAQIIDEAFAAIGNGQGLEGF